MIILQELIYRDSRSMSSDFDIPSGRMRGMAATHVLNKSILGFLSPLERSDFKISCNCFLLAFKLIKQCDYKKQTDFIQSLLNYG